MRGWGGKERRERRVIEREVFSVTAHIYVDVGLEC